MATRTWNATIDTDFTNNANWAEGAYPVAGDTIVHASGTVASTNRPTDGPYHILVNSAVVGGNVGNYVAAPGTIGNVTVSHAGASPSCTKPITGNLEVTAGTFNLGAPVTGTTNIAAGAVFNALVTVTLTGAATVAGALTVGNAVTLTFTAGLTLSGSLTLTGTGKMAGPVTFAGTVNLLSNWALAGQAVDLAGAAVVAGGNVTIDGTDATSVTHSRCCLFSNGSGKTLTVDYLPVQTVPIHAYCGVANGGHNHASAVVYHPGPPGTMLMGVAA